MQIQKGLVKYKDRSDIVCTYGVTEDGRQYYFLDDNPIENGNIIASTVLIEAIDPVVPASSVGLIDSNGNVVIPFENKSVKLLSNNLLLVEKVNPTTDSVLEAIGLRSDPLAATKLVTTSAAIKEKMNASMGAEGRFVFNDQFSEATICDINGNNLVNGEYFSFIGLRGDSLFLSKNTAESEVVEVVMNENNVVSEEQPSDEVNTFTGEEVSEQDFTVEEGVVDNNPLDVQSAEVSQEMIDNAMSEQVQGEKVLVKENSGFDMSEDITAKNFEGESFAEEHVVVPEVEVDGQTASVENEGDVSEEVPVAQEAVSEIGEGEDSDANDVFEKALSEETTSEQFSNLSEDADVDDNKSDDEIGESVADLDTQYTTEEDTFVSSEDVSEKNEPVSEDEVVQENTTDSEPMSFDFGDNINYNAQTSRSDNDDFDLPLTNDADSDVEVDSFDQGLLDMDLDTDIFADHKLHADTISMDDDYIGYSYKNNTPQKDTIIEDVAVTLSNLIKLNKGQRKTIIAYEEKMDQYASIHKKVVEKARTQIREIENLKTKVKNYETIVTKLEAKNQVLESRVHDQDRIIATQTSELETLRPQVEGKQELVKLLADAQNLLSQDGYSDSSEDSYIKMMAA